MARIQSSVGLITGIPIEETVNKLMQVAAQPRELLAARTKTLNSERLAVSNLTSLTLAFQFEVNKLSGGSLFETKAVTSSDSDVIKASLTENGNPAVGNYRFRSLQTASAQQLASNSFQSIEDLGTNGTLSIGFGGFVDKGIALDQLNAGAGVRRGTIRITDKAGNAADIDLRAARTIDDVLKAINKNDKAQVTASVDGDSIVLTDNSGGGGSLKVQEVGGGKTALDLGLSTINTGSSQATGVDVFSLHAATKLSALNDGTGVPLVAGDDLSVTLADGSALNIDLGSATTLGDVITAINTAGSGKLSAAIGADGNRIVLSDLTTGSDAFAVTSASGGTAAESLGLTATAAGSTLTGKRLASGLRDTLVSSLRGGQGIGTLGTINVTNRNNVASSVNLAAAETLDDVVDAINAQATGVNAAINSSRNGITLTDTTGGTASNLIIADGDANNTATKLGITVNSSATSINSGTLDRRQISRATLLSSLNSGKGVDIGDIKITDSNGTTDAVDLNAAGNEVKTIGDVIDRINALTGANVEARINDSGDGIVLIDHAGGTGSLKVEEVGNHTTATDLRLFGTGKTKTVDGQPAQVIDGTTRLEIDLSDLDDAGAGISLSALNSGKGVKLGAFRITDRNGESSVVNLSKSAGTFSTVADVLNAINATSIGVEARINDAGNGILLFDNSGGTGTLAIEDLAGGTTAADLGLAKTAATTVVDSVETQAINGAGTFFETATQSGLSALASRINDFKAGVTANTIYDGTGYRLVLNVDQSGAGNELLVDGLDVGLSFDELSEARDAVVEFGGTAAGTGLLVTSSDNTFENIVPGLDITVEQASDETITVDVEKSQSNITTAVQDFVDAFNSIRDNIDKVTAFDADAKTTGILFGTTAVQRVENDLNHVLTGRFFGVGRFTSLESLGLSFTDKGKLTFNKTKFEKALDTDAASVKNFFTNETTGLSAKLKTTINQLAGEDKSVLTSRAKVLGDVIASNNDKVSFMDDRLDKEKERLTNLFAQLESTIAGMRQNLSALASFQPVAPLSVTRQ